MRTAASPKPEPSRGRPCVVVLAAGGGTRFDGGGHKLLQPVGDRAVVEHTLHHAVASGLPVLAVASVDVAAVAKRVLGESDVLVVAPAVAQRGIGMSIATGVAARAAAGGWLILPGDLPLVRPATIAAVAGGLLGGGADIAYARHGGRRGHPVAFAARHRAALCALDGDRGAVGLLQPPNVALAVDVDDDGVHADIDTEGDLQALRARWPARPAC